MKKVHNLKIRPEYFQAVICRKKKAEFRIADRDFSVGDLLCLNEYGPCKQDERLIGFTGNIVYVQITHINDLSEWAEGFVMISFEVVPHD